MSAHELEDLRGLLDEMLAETGGPLTARERRDAERALGLAPRGHSTRARSSRPGADDREP